MNERGTGRDSKVNEPDFNELEAEALSKGNLGVELLDM